MRCLLILFAMLFLFACQPKIIYVTESQEKTSAKKDGNRARDKQMMANSGHHDMGNTDNALDDEGYVCGNHLCPTGTYCEDNNCYCFGTSTPYLENAANYICENDEFICSKDVCKCGIHGCGRGGRCENMQCVCGINSIVAPKDTGNYSCFHDESGEENVAFWTCVNTKGCSCGINVCGYNSVCEEDSSCYCGNTLAPSLYPERYDCDGFYSMWVCNDKRGCPFADGTCDKGEMLTENQDECVRPIAPPDGYAED